MDFLGDLWHFPFYSNVWGTASDVVMVIVTSLTLLALILTLRSQNKAIELQRLALNEQVTEKQIYKLQLRPDIRIEINDSIYLTENENLNKVQYSLKFIIIDADAYNFYVRDEHSINTSVIIPDEIFSFATKNLNFPRGKEFITEIYFNSGYDNHSHQPLSRILVFYFKDVLGNRYKKIINIKSNMVIDFTTPIEIG